MVSPETYLSNVTAGRLPHSFVSQLSDSAFNTYKIFMFKGERRLSDSRDRRGLAGELEITLLSSNVRAGESLRGTYPARNTGENIWLHSGTVTGRLEIGVHVSSLGGRLVDYLFFPIERDRPTMPGEQIEGEFTIVAPPSGSYVFRFDLDAKNVCWFATNGSKTVDISVAVE
jgi:hypothetical protein